MSFFLDYFTFFFNASKDFLLYVLNEVTFNVSPWYINYFWWLIFLSVTVWALEIIFPWRKNQPIIRKDFWMDLFYILFNFYIFKIIIFIGFSLTIERLFLDLLNIEQSLFLFNVQSLHPTLQLLLFFVLIDFISWGTHILLHKNKFLWQFHKVHHSVEQMGFAAHFRFHWMETIVYTPSKYIVLIVLGNFEPNHAFIVYYLTIAIGHLNHSNINVNYGPLKYIFNNPKMHIWHHSKHLPKNFKTGVNFAISLSIWDYVFKTNYIPYDGGNNRLGFENIATFPKTFLTQISYGFKKSKD